MNELKPCPFCGGEAHIRTGVTTSIPRVSKAIVVCKNCNSSSDWFYDHGLNGEFIMQAIEAWNRRTDDGKAD